MEIPIAAHIASASYVIPAVSGIVYWKKQNTYLKVFTVFCVYSIIHIIAEFVLGRFGIPNQLLSNVYRLLQLECLFLLYGKWIQINWVEISLKIFAIAYFLFWLIDFIFFPFPREFHESIATTANFLMLISSLVILEHLFRNTREAIFDHSIFWISTGIIIYSSGTIIVLTMSNTILRMGIDYFILLWHINWGFTLIANLFYARSFRCNIF